MLPNSRSYEAVCDDFQWEVPSHFNIGVDVCDRWAVARPQAPAIISERADGSALVTTFAQLRATSNRLANAMRARGVARGDRVAILLPQCPETAIAHIAVYKLGAIAVPLFSLFGEEALSFRLGNSGARMLITDEYGVAKVAGIRGALPDLSTVLVCASTDFASRDGESFEAAVRAEDPEFEPADTKAEDPALIIYTSGTTGKPKGALHAHRTLLGHLPGVEMSHGGGFKEGDLLWTPADWAWIGGLLDVLLPALHHGIPVLAHRFGKFDAAQAFELMSRHRVRNAFLPPTALKMLRQERDAARRWPLHLRSVASGGESLGAEVLRWGLEVLGIRINEFYGQTECNMVVSSCDSWFDARAGWVGKAVPGHDVRIVDPHGRILPAGEVGQIGVRRPDPVMFLGYWNNAQATAEKFAGEFLLTGDLGCMDDAGFIRFVGRDDDVITSGGYRIGPGPIEDCLLGHPSVRMAAVVGVPDEQRTEVVKAFVVVSDGVTPDADLTRELQDRVRTRLAAHEYPRQVEYVSSLPMTATGKVIRRALRPSG